MLSATGASYIEVSSFVHPDWIPQLKDATEVARKIKRHKDVTYAALVPNLKGLERALEVDIDEVCLFISASETHNKNNINRTIAETYPILRDVSQEAKQAGKKVRGYVSTVFGCPYEGKIDLDRKSTRLNSSHVANSYAVFCLKKKTLYYLYDNLVVYDMIKY